MPAGRKARKRLTFNTPNREAAGSIASSATSAPAPRPASPASNAPTACGAALAWARPAQDLCLVLGNRLEFRPLRPPQIELTCHVAGRNRTGTTPGGCQCAHFHQKSWPPQFAPMSHAAWLQSGHQAGSKRAASTRKPAVYGWKLAIMRQRTHKLVKHSTPCRLSCNQSGR